VRLFFQGRQTPRLTLSIDAGIIMVSK